MQRRLLQVSTVQLLKHWDLNDTIPSSMPLLDRWLETEAQNRPLTVEEEFPSIPPPRLGVR